MTTNYLVSIAVLTYNQDKFIIECLDSIREQTYANIEIIISDDCSTDNTVTLVKNWLHIHASVFSKSIFVQNIQNIGISANHTKAARVATGKYFKYLGGDDILHPSAIEKMVRFAEENSFDWFTCQTASYIDNFNIENYYATYPSVRWIFSRNHRQQIKRLIVENFINAPGVFMKLEILKSVGYFEERFQTREDYHTWLSLMHRGHAIRLLPEPLVFWRRHEDSVSYTVHSTSNSLWFDEELLTIENYMVNNLKWYNMLLRIHLTVLKKYYSSILQDSPFQPKKYDYLLKFDIVHVVQSISKRYVRIVKRMTHKD